MLTLEAEKISATSYGILNDSIKETFTAIDRFEWQAVGEILQMRDQELYLKADYTSFKEYCQAELSAWGGYRRINQLLGAKKVIDAADELGGNIKNERQARPLLRLVKEPDKLKQAVAIALSENPSPSESDFAAAAKKVVPPPVRKKHSIEEPLVPEKIKVTVTSQSHYKYGESGVVEADPPNNWQQIVTFPDGERVLVNNADLTNLSNDAIVSFSHERAYPKEYSEAIAQLKQQHQQELERLEQELRIGLLSEATAKAEEQVQEQIQSLQQLFQQQKEQNIQLQQRLDEMEALRQLEFENQQLKQRIQELEHAVQEHPSQQWGNTFNKQATKALNKEIKRSLEKTIDLRLLAEEPPKENATECLRLMGMALSNLSSAMNNTQALQAAALILGSEPTPQAIAFRAEQLQLIPQAVNDIRQVLSKPECTWQDYLSAAQEYEVIKQDYLAELTPQEIELITALEKVECSPITEPLVIQETPADSGSSNCDLRSRQRAGGSIANCELIKLASIVAHADPYDRLYIARGKVVEDLGEEVVVAWDHSKEKFKKTDRYSREKLRLL